MDGRVFPHSREQINRAPREEADDRSDEEAGREGGTCAAVDVHTKGIGGAREGGRGGRAQRYYIIMSDQVLVFWDGTFIKQYRVVLLTLHFRTRGVGRRTGTGTEDGTACMGYRSTAKADGSGWMGRCRCCSSGCADG